MCENVQKILLFWKAVTKNVLKKVSTKKDRPGPSNDYDDNDDDLYIQMKARVRKVERPVERGNCNLIVIILDKLARCNCNCSL